MTDTPQPPPAPQHTLLWIIVGAVLVVLALAWWQGWL
jgi:hypothetical protein